MSSNTKRLKKAGKNLGGNLAEVGKAAKETALEGVATAVQYVRKEGGVGKLASKVFRRVAGAVGKAAGEVGKAGSAAVGAVEDVLIEKKDEPMAVERLGEKISRVYKSWRDHFETNYKGSKIDPDDISRKFEEAAKQGTDVLGGLCERIKKGTDAVSNDLKRYIPSEADYKVTISERDGTSRDYMVSRSILIKPEVTKARKYLEFVAKVLPGKYEGRTSVLESIANNGIRSNSELAKKQPEIYGKISRYLKR